MAYVWQAYQNDGLGSLTDVLNAFTKRLELSAQRTESAEKRSFAIECL